jgi:hypothetical protein
MSAADVVAERDEKGRSLAEGVVVDESSRIGMSRKETPRSLMD